MDSIYPIRPLDFDGITTYPISDRRGKVDVEMFARPATATATVGEFVAGLPKLLAGEQLRRLLDALVRARRDNRAILWGMGGHVIKCGLGPVVVDLMESGFVSGVVMNGSAAIHDFEVALVGSTSEEVEAELGSGRFGMARETGAFMNSAINAGVGEGLGIGESLGGFIVNSAKSSEFRHTAASVLAQAFVRRIPVTVHVAIGTDTIHAHPQASGPALGEGTMRDFRLFCSLVRALDGGGVYLNLGSAVILPEVFLKAVSIVRNLGHALECFTTANLDFIQHYRPTQNVLRRPTQGSGQSIALTGHHEIMVPLIAAALKQAQ